MYLCVIGFEKQHWKAYVSGSKFCTIAGRLANLTDSWRVKVLFLFPKCFFSKIWGTRVPKPPTETSMATSSSAFENFSSKKLTQQMKKKRGVIMLVNVCSVCVSGRITCFTQWQNHMFHSDLARLCFTALLGQGTRLHSNGSGQNHMQNQCSEITMYMYITQT